MKADAGERKSDVALAGQIEKSIDLSGAGGYYYTDLAHDNFQYAANRALRKATERCPVLHHGLCMKDSVDIHLSVRAADDGSLRQLLAGG